MQIHNLVKIKPKYLPIDSKQAAKRLEIAVILSCFYYTGGLYDQ